MGIFRLSSQFIVWKTFVKQWENFWGRGVVESNFIINFHVFFVFFGVGGDFKIFIAIYQ